MKPLATRLAAAVAQAGLTVGVAESLTAGVLAQSFIEVPGSGDWFAGAVVAYMTRVKHSVLGVQAERVITEQAAREMAIGAARVLGADLAISTTGNAGPEPMEDQRVGTVWIGVTLRGRAFAVQHCFEGDPDTVRMWAVRAALDHAFDAVAP